jgi:hypothetical protein
MLISSDQPIPELTRLIALWVPDLSAKHRIAEELIPGFVPPPLRAIYEFAGNYPISYDEQWRQPRWTPGLFGPQDRLLPPDQLDLAGDRFRFIIENQGCWLCETVGGHDDPPVYLDSLAGNGETGNTKQICSSLSHFLTTFCLQELVFGSKYLICVDREELQVQQLVSHELTEVWIDGIYVYEQPTHSFYLCDRGLLVMDMGSGGKWLAFNDESYRSLIVPEILRIAL